MRRYIKYLSLLAILVVSCQKIGGSPDRIFSEGGLISFSTHVETRTPLITELNGETFGVYGYKFSNLTNWGTYKTGATPNLFYNLEVNCDEDGICEYYIDSDTDIEGQEQWELSQRYSYFAYFPYNEDVNGLAPSASDKMNDPYLVYTLPLSSEELVNPDSMIDVMTAKVTDWSPSNGTVVRFEFNHRLFCIELYGHNFNTDEVVISDLSMTISGIRYNEATIYLDGSIPTQPSSVNWSHTDEVTFLILDSDEQTSISGSTELSLTENKLIALIPQTYKAKYEGEVPVGLTIRIDFKKKDGESWNSVSREATYNIDFVEKLKYGLDLNFVGSDVILVQAEPATWDSKNIQHTFD